MVEERGSGYKSEIVSRSRVLGMFQRKGIATEYVQREGRMHGEYTYTKARAIFGVRINLRQRSERNQDAKERDNAC